MRVAPTVELNPEQKQVLDQRSCSRPVLARVVERARIVLLAAGGKQDKDIASDIGISVQEAARWRSRFLEGGVTSLERDAPRPGRTPSISAKTVERVIEMTMQERPANATHWSTRSMAQAVGLSEASVRRIWHKHGLKPHLVETFKVSKNPRFAE